MTHMRGNPSIAIRLPRSLIERVDAEAERRMVHRALITTRALNAWLEKHEGEDLL